MSPPRRSRPARPRPTPQDWAPTPLPNWHGLLNPVVARTFEELRVGVAVWISDDWWHPIHSAQSVVDFEYEHGVAPRRHAYNHRCFEAAGSLRKVVVGEHAGYFDFFVPLVDSKQVRGILVAGPFAKARPTSAQIQERWHAITGARARLTDPMFARYLTLALSTLTLHGARLEAFERLLSCFAQVLLAQGDSATLAVEAGALQQKLARVRLPEQMWGSVRDMVEAPSAEAWAFHAYGEMAAFGVKSFPEHVVVGLALGRLSEQDPIDDRLRRDAFQRACVALAREQGDIVCGRVGDHGVVFLVNDAASGQRLRTKLADLATRTRATARRFGLALRVGVSPRVGSAPLRERYHAALAAAERALSQDQSLVWAEPHAGPSDDRLRQLRTELGKGAGDRPKLLSVRFDHYIEAVLTHSGYRPDVTRAHLEAGLERLIEPLLAAGLLDAKGYGELRAESARGAEGARTIVELVDSYRRVVLDIESATEQPTAARHDRGTRRALDFIREHLADPITLTQVARVAGFAPNYFGNLLKRSEGVTFSRYVQGLRIEHAKKMLAETTLGIEQVQRLSGFRSRTHF
ncbi:MAG TPA: AraC family transcriptional regulator, partial [Polyangiaceae bacterium]|nr:AraC family transcriptional regulator [Polyangiaceae bacterium]